jgi:hypothetical protein
VSVGVFFSVIVCYKIICLGIIINVWIIFSVKYNVKSKVYSVTCYAGTERWSSSIALLFL